MYAHNKETRNEFEMKNSSSKKKSVRIGILDSDPVRYVGFASLLSGARDFDVQPVSMADLAQVQLDILLVTRDPRRNATDVLAYVRVQRPDVRIVLTSPRVDEAGVMNAIAAGARACLDESAPVDELIRTIRAVHEGSIWAPRTVLASVVERVYNTKGQNAFPGPQAFTKRERDVLRMLVAGCSNKEIAAPLGIEERTVKAHVAKLMRKVGVENRIMLSMHAINHSLVSVE
jgi:DNA-binding NarL/FixJ family response regulator